MFKTAYFPAFLLCCLHYLSCTIPSEPFTQNQQEQPLPIAVSTTLLPDTAGLYQALRCYAEINQLSTSSLPPPYWRMLTLTGADSGMIPLSTYLDDSTGFEVLFFRKGGSGFHFYTISAFTGQTIIVPPLPEHASVMQRIGER